MEGQLLQDFVRGSSPEHQQIAFRLMEIIEASGEDLDCAIKWGQLTYAKNADFHHWILAIKMTKKYVGLVFHFGGLLEDPNGIFISGASKFGRKLEYRRIEDIDKEIVLDFLRQALNKLPYFKEHWKEIQKNK